MANPHVRARCRVTGAIAALPRRALQLGHIPGWVEVPGPPPRRPKSAAFRKRAAARAAEDADSESANTEEE